MKYFVKYLGTTYDSLVALQVQEVPSQGSRLFDINSDIAHGQKLRFLLRCKSRIGMVASFVSHWITVVLEAPNVEHAALSIIHESNTIYPQRGNVISNGNTLWVKWSGIASDVDIDHCEVRFKRELFLSSNSGHFH